jgi:hypothetical protein
MFDTTVFNRVLDGNLDAKLFAPYAIFATHVQVDELAQTREPRRSELLAIFERIEPAVLNTSTAIWGDSKWGQSCFSSQNGLYEKMLDRLIELDKERRRKKSRINQSRDIRIAKTALRNGCELVSDDQALREVMIAFNGEATSSAEF